MPQLVRILLIPVSLLYGLGVSIRNLLYDLGVFPSVAFRLPTISVGNLSVGGTGKSPHVEYLLRLLSKDMSVATLSRGYGRKTRGFRLADADSTASDIGDEPRQFKQKFKEVPVAVDGNRVRGIKKLKTLIPEIQTIILDDAYQHRSLKPGLSILLTDYSRPYIEDYLLPSGRLRESKAGRARADIIIVTKTPTLFSPLERRILKKKLRPKPYQKVYFSYIKYGDFQPFHDKGQGRGFSREFYAERNFSILLVTGIAKGDDLADEIKDQAAVFKHISFPDHHRYSPLDLQKIRNIFDSFAQGNKLILTTEKDAMRLALPGLNDLVKDLPLFYLPIEIAFHGNDEEEFNEQIVNYVGRNQVNSSTPAGTN